MTPEWAREYIGIPFSARGRSKDGVDCWGLCRMIWEERFNLDVPSYSEHYDDTGPREARRIAEAISLHGTGADAWMPIVAGGERLGDAILLRLMGRPVHVGLVLGDKTMIHCEVGHNTVLERYDRSKWNKRILGFWRHERFDANINNQQA